jgi:hypothetical protein
VHCFLRVGEKLFIPEFDTHVFYIDEVTLDSLSELYVLGWRKLAWAG